MPENLIQIAKPTRVDWYNIHENNFLYGAYRKIRIRSVIIIKKGPLCQHEGCENPAECEVIETPLALKDIKDDEYALDELILSSEAEQAVKAFRSRVSMCTSCAFKGVL